MRNRNSTLEVAATEVAPAIVELSLDDPTMVYIPPVQIEAPVPRVSKSLADRGRGRPDAKKICNPQPTLELKKSAVRAAGGSIGYARRQWFITVPHDDGDKAFTFWSREFAALTVGALCNAIGIELPK
jgi:hypothetical protein